MTSLETLRRRAKSLRKAFEAGAPDARERLRQALPNATQMKHADALHVVAREEGHASWPQLKFALETQNADLRSLAERLARALHFGQHWRVAELLDRAPELSVYNLALGCALYNADYVREVLAKSPEEATKLIFERSPLCHLAFSKHLHGEGSESAMLACTELLLEHGADPNDFYNYDNNPDEPLSVLYGAIGHSNNMPLARLLLEKGANPNDGESAYHATELGHHEGLRLLIAHGVEFNGTNAMLRAMDFNDHDAVQMMLDAGADPNQTWAAPGGDLSDGGVRPLHQAARRLNDAKMARILLHAGADPKPVYDGLTPYALARIYGNTEVAETLRDHGGAVELTGQAALMAAVADDARPEGQYIDPAKLSDEMRNILGTLLATGGALDHVKRLVAAGMPWDDPDEMGLTPVQNAGWWGDPETVAYFLSLKPDLSHRNGYGGTLLGTIMHGSENCPARAERDHLACIRLALEEGVALPRRASEVAGDETMAAFLADWAEAHPGQVVDETQF